MSSKLKLLSLLPILCAMSACGHDSTEPPVVVSDYCVIARPIEYDSERDSRETVSSVEAHNSKWACVCEHDCPKK